MAILAIDQGTSGTKVLIVASDGRVLARGFALVELVHLAGGGVECVAEQLWQSVVDAANMAFSNWSSKGEIIEAVALANQGESVLAWDVGSTEALSPVIIWQDARSASLCEDRNEKLAMVRARTGLTLDPYFVAPKMAWLRANVTRGGVVTTSDAWLIARLTGAFATDVTTACRSLLFDLQRQCWDSELLAMWGLESEQLPSIVANDVVVGTVGHSELRFLRDVPLAGVIVDQPAALFAQTCLDPGQAKCTYGTGAFLLANIGPMMRLSNHGLVTSIAWTVQGTTAHYFDGQVFTAGSAVQGLIDNGLLVPQRGTVTLSGEPVAVMRARKQIAWMAQAPALLPWLTVVQNVRLALQVNPQPGSSFRDPIAMVNAVGLAEFADAYPATLSGGMQQRAALARTLVLGAGLWLLDEQRVAREVSAQRLQLLRHLLQHFCLGAGAAADCGVQRDLLAE